MGKGHHGETCAEAMEKAIHLLGNRASAQDIFDKVRKMGGWSEKNIWLGLMHRVVNLPPSYRYWPRSSKGSRFLFLREDGDYELYRSERHGIYVLGRKVA